jgi:hypothetical protein
MSEEAREPRQEFSLLPKHLWYEAYANPPGLKLTVIDREQALNHLYTARKVLADPDLAHLRILTSPFAPNEIWIIVPARPEPIPPDAIFDLGDI